MRMALFLFSSPRCGAGGVGAEREKSSEELDQEMKDRIRVLRSLPNSRYKGLTPEQLAQKLGYREGCMAWTLESRPNEITRYEVILCGWIDDEVFGPVKGKELAAWKAPLSSKETARALRRIG